eukprot:TRINITY_DN174_c0_g1_i1.p1 TRINITY_DN174_c0_g1~~TRINITY_DN174_c0_g1_i1.p1  ORF type:complete len:336 (-),score=88.46 TRINITY_DN174_c0_g1_i1:253-1260(-)
MVLGSKPRKTGVPSASRTNYGTVVSALADDTLNMVSAKSAEGKSFQDCYRLGQKMGKGHFAVVYAAVDKNTGQKVAVKVLQKKYTDSNKQKQVDILVGEISTAAKLDHPNVISIHQVFEDTKHVYLISDLMLGGELTDRVMDRGGYTEAEAAVVMVQVVRAVAYCHSRGVSHRDLKLDNILYVDDSEHLKVTDFGLSKVLSDNEGGSFHSSSDTTVKMRTFCGTLDYMAPEIVLGKEYDHRVDWWSVGVIFFVMLAHEFPSNASLEDRKHQMARGFKVEFTAPIWQHVSIHAQDLISHLLEWDPAKRYQSKDIFAHPWYAEAEKLVAKQLPHLKE